MFGSELGDYENSNSMNALPLNYEVAAVCIA